MIGRAKKEVIDAVELRRRNLIALTRPRDMYLDKGAGVYYVIDRVQDGIAHVHIMRDIFLDGFPAKAISLDELAAIYDLEVAYFQKVLATQ